MSGTVNPPIFRDIGYKGIHPVLCILFLLFFFMLFLWVFQPFIFEFKLDKSAAEALEQIAEQLTSGWLLIRNN